jgi:D-inositol-3-phosphate glycosyltransferase
MLTVHTSPLDQPGAGDAGGMNVAVEALARRLAAMGIEVDIFTRATSSHLPPIVELTPGVFVRHVTAGPYQGLDKEDLPAVLCAFTAGVLRVEAAHELGWYDLVHSHYWLSGQVGTVAAERWGVPLVHTMHTMARVKNQALAPGETPEPSARVVGETQVVDAADRLVANTPTEAQQLIDLYDADPGRVDVVRPGVDLDVFHPGARSQARARVGLPKDAVVLLFVGRLQPHKGPDVLLHTAAELARRDASLRDRLVVAIVGGPSGRSCAGVEALSGLAGRLGLDGHVRWTPPVPQAELADWYQAADLTIVPSHSESFGLVALESQACGTPVVAADVGGLSTAVRDGQSGVLVDGHDPRLWADVVAQLLADPGRRAQLGAGGVAHAAGLSWSATAARMAQVYAEAIRQHGAGELAAVNR